MTPKPIFLTALALTAASAGGASTVAAQGRPVTAAATAGVDVKRFPEMPLDGYSGPDTSQMGDVWGLPGVRNVTHATLTPFLPPADIATGTAVVIAPGGAFVYLSVESEGYAVARWFASRGIAAFVLKYRVQPTPRDPKAFTEFAMGMVQKMTDPAAPKVEPMTPPEAFADGQAALRLVRSKAASFGVDPKRVGFVGFSAGAVLAMSVGLADNPTERPDFIGNLYGSPETRAVPADAPPVFLGLALDDPISARGQLGLINSYRAAKRPIEAHFYGSGGHGFGMDSKSAATAMWTEEMYAWLKDRGLLATAGKK